MLRLYVAGMTPKSTLAVTNIKKICEEHLAGRYSLEVIDLYKRPALADGEQIIAAPTLLKKLPLPLRQIHRGHVQHGKDPRGAGPAARRKVRGTVNERPLPSSL